MKLDKLFKRTKTGAIQYWEIETRSSDLLEGAQIRKTSGQLGTDKPIEHIESIHEGKNIGKANETTPEQQADLQAKSDWLKKKDEGYKSASDMGWDDKTDLTLSQWLDVTLPQFNSDAAGNPKPMLATDWNKVKDIKYPCYIQPKLDGVRCLMIVKSHHTSADITFLSRSGKPYTTLAHIEYSLIEYLAGSEQEFILDGEIYSDELSFQEIVAAVKKERPESAKLQFRAYDIIDDKIQEYRLPQMEKLVIAINSQFITSVNSHIAFNKDEVKNLHDKFVQEGYEGAMIRLTDGIYGQGQRSRHLLKVKEFNETEFRFMKWEIGQRPEDLIAVCTTDGKEVSEMLVDKKYFKAKMIGNLNQKKALQDSSIKVGDLLTVKHFGWTEDKLPRFPIGKGFRNYE